MGERDLIEPPTSTWVHRKNNREIMTPFDPVTRNKHFRNLMRSLRALFNPHDLPQHLEHRHATPDQI